MTVSPRIALFADAGNDQIAVLADCLRERGATPIVFDIQLGGASASRIHWDRDELGWDGVDFADIRAAHIRCTAPNVLPTPPAMLNELSFNDWRGDFLREQHYQSATYGFFDELEARGTLVINPLTSAYLDHNAKAQLYHKLRAWGFDVPTTISTNDPTHARAFVEEYGRVVVKPAIGVGSTRMVAPADLQRLDEVHDCPALLQEYIPGSVIRVHIVGDTMVLALRIKGEFTDSRTFTEGFEFHQMPPEAAQKIVQANRRLGLHFAAWDVMATADGRYVYLDCNPGPWLMWIGDTYVRGVLGELAKYMITYARSGSISDASAAVSVFEE